MTSASFHELLKELHVQHDLEIAALQAQLAELQTSSSAGISIEVQAASDSSGDQDHTHHNSTGDLQGRLTSMSPASSLSILSLASDDPLPDPSMATEVCVARHRTSITTEFSAIGGSEANSSTNSFGHMFNLRPEWSAGNLPINEVIASQKQFVSTRLRSSFTLGTLTSSELRMGASSRFVLHPRSRVRLIWEIFGVALLCIDTIWLPLQAFDIPANTVSFMLAVVPMLFWTCDIPMNFFVGFYARDGHVEDRVRAIAARYLKSWFVPDLVLVCNDWVSFVFVWLGAENTGLARMAKFTRLGRNLRNLRMLRMAKLTEMLAIVHRSIPSETFTLVFEMFISAVSLILLNHGVACMWFHLGSASREDTWLRARGLDHSDIIAQYSLALHWSLAQFTPASMEVNPQNTTERVFTVVVILFAMIIFSSFVSSITSGMTRLKMLTSEAAAQQYLLRAFLRDNRISHDLSTRITRHIGLALEAQRKSIPMPKVQLLSYLTSPLHLELQKELFSPWLRMHPFFFKYIASGSEAVREICSLAMKQHAFSIDDIVFKRGNEASHMYFVADGLIRYKMPWGQIVPLQQGSWLSEAVIWLPWVHMGTAKAVLDSEVASLNAATFSQVTIKFPDAFDLSQQRATDFLDVLMAIQEVHDIPDQPTQDPKSNSFVQDIAAEGCVTAPTRGIRHSYFRS